MIESSSGSPSEHATAAVHDASRCKSQWDDRRDRGAKIRVRILLSFP
jgi:hypothetical protein